MKGWTDATTNTQAEADARPAIAALQTLQTRLEAITFPANAVADVHALIAADGSLDGDLQALASVNLLNASSWNATFERDIASVSADANLVRHDLGLPPASS